MAEEQVQAAQGKAGARANKQVANDSKAYRTSAPTQPCTRIGCTRAPAQRMHLEQGGHGSD